MKEIENRKPEVLDADAFIKSLPISSILELCGFIERKDSEKHVSIIPLDLKPSIASLHSKILQIQAMVPAEILCENGTSIDWFLRAEIRDFNAEVASINGILENCLTFQVYSNFKAIQSSIYCIIQDEVPPDLPHPRSSSSLRSFLSGLTRKRNYFQAWLQGGPPICHDISLYNDISSFLAYLCIECDQAAYQDYQFSLRVARFENAHDVSAKAPQGVFVQGIRAYQCKWDAKKRRFCSLAATDKNCAYLPICLLSLDHGVHDVDAGRRSLPVYNLQCCDGKELAVASFSVGIQEECIEIMISSNANLACK